MSRLLVLFLALAMLLGCSPAPLVEEADATCAPSDAGAAISSPAPAPDATTSGTVDDDAGACPVCSCPAPVVCPEAGTPLCPIADAAPAASAKYPYFVADGWPNEDPDPADMLAFVAIDGDSITGDSLVGFGEYPGVTLALLGARVIHGAAIGESGETLAGPSGMIAGVLWRLPPYGYPNTTLVVTVTGGTNDINYHDAGPPEIVEFYRQYCSLVHSMSWRCVAGGLPNEPRMAVSVRDAVNAALRAAWTSFADGFADFGADTRLVTTSLDGTHPDEDGKIIMAQILADAVKPVIEMGRCVPADAGSGAAVMCE